MSPSICAALRAAISAISPSGPRAKLPMLIYHRVLPDFDPLRPEEITAGAFRWQMKLVAHCFHALTVSQAAHRLRTASLPARAICVTFDDGYRDNAEVALPILKEFNIPATFFISAGYLSNGRMWNDTLIETLRYTSLSTLDLRSKGLGTYSLGTVPQRAATAKALVKALKYAEPGERERLADDIARLVPGDLPNNLMMFPDQVVALDSAGMEIGAHTVTHPILANVSVARARQEIVVGREWLEDLIGRRVTAFAYPNGKPGKDYTSTHVRMVRRAGFEAAVSTVPGVSDSNSCHWELPRFTPWDATPTRFALRLLINYRQGKTFLDF